MDSFTPSAVGDHMTLPHFAPIRLDCQTSWYQGGKHHPPQIATFVSRTLHISPKRLKLLILTAISNSPKDLKLPTSATDEKYEKPINYGIVKNRRKTTESTETNNEL